MNLTKSDYKEILKYYNIHFSDNLPITLLRKMAEKIIAEKLCSCFKKVPNKDQPESRAIGICNYSVVKRKNLKINGITCKKRPQLKSKKNNKNQQNLIKIVNNKIILNKKNNIKN